MTISTTTNRISYNGNGTTVAFAFPYYFILDADLKVYVDGALQVLTTNYTVSGAGNLNGGTVTFVSAPATGTGNVLIIRDPAVTQTTDWLEGDADSAEVKERAHDKAVILLQRIVDRLDRVPNISDLDTLTTLTFPLLADRLSKYLAFDASGNLVATDRVADTAIVSAFMETVLDDATATAALATLGAEGAVTTDFADDTDLTLSVAEYTAHTIVLTDTGGVLTAARNVIMPTNVRVWVVDNQTAQILTIKTSTGTGKAVAAGGTVVVYGDGTNIKYAIIGHIEASEFVHKPPTTGGTGSAYTVTLGLTALTSGEVYTVDIHTENTSTAPTLDIDSLGAITIKTEDGLSIVDGLLEAGVHSFKYDGTDLLTIGFKPGLIEEQEVTGSAVTTLSFTGLDINKHRSYRVELEYKNAGTASAALCFINNDTTTTNYHSQRVQGDGATASSARGNNALMSTASANGIAFCVARIGLSNGYAAWTADTTQDIGSSIVSLTYNGAKTNATVSNITQIDLTTATATQFAVGTKARLYRSDA